VRMPVTALRSAAPAISRKERNRSAKRYSLKMEEGHTKATEEASNFRYDGPDEVRDGRRARHSCLANDNWRSQSQSAGCEDGEDSGEFHCYDVR